MEKTLIGKDNYLFLTNDSSQELKVHCENLNLINDAKLSHLNFQNYILVVFPNKSLYYSCFLPDQYVVKYRPVFDIYNKKLKDKILDGYEFLKNEKDLYYKTDTHINLKGNYIIYLEFIKKCNLLYNTNLSSKNINILKLTNVNLNSLNVGIGDLTWPGNLGNQILKDDLDNYYYSNDIELFYPKYVITFESEYMFYDYDLNNKTSELINNIVEWNVVSKYIIYKKNIHKKNKVIIFYDSFILSILPLYMELFYEVYMIKNLYNNELINLINPDYVFEFRVERFLI
jgi:hypothetical protein